ncbi:hypothetical protein SO802_030229 [Lithocarpus litseifolius]|uniref:MBD domain-containing protein n=1 Tax=Lithocarpus litseifolius TaxID=425828 RepID=A0AAW2BIP5_9ROSI
METTEGQPRMLSEDQQQPQMPKVHFVDGKDYGLPEGWIVEQRPRTSAKYFGKLDQFYHEVKTKKRFRSLKEAKKYVKMEGNETKKTPEVSQPGGHSKDSQSSKSCSSNISKKKNKITQTFDFANPPEAITWVLSDAENNDWSPFTGETMVPVIVKTHWAETFICINEENNNPSFV